jgi:hypothetical protein
MELRTLVMRILMFGWSCAKIGEVRTLKTGAQRDGMLQRNVVIAQKLELDRPVLLNSSPTSQEFLVSSGSILTGKWNCFAMSLPGQHANLYSH